MTKKTPAFTAGLVVILLLLLTCLVPAIQDAPAAQESHPPRPLDRRLDEIPFLDTGERQTEAAADLAAPNMVPWSKLTFQSYRDLDDWEIYRANNDGSGQVRLTNNHDSDIHARLNRGCTQIAFASDRDGDYEILVITIDGSETTRLTRNSQDDVLPAWSPDGTRLAFQSYRDGQAEIYVMNADGSGQTRLTWHADYDGEPIWSPDGTQIAFTSRRTGGYRIWVMNADGSGKVQRSTQSYSENPAWSPDGSQIAYDSDGDGDGWLELWLMNADGTNQHEVYDPPQAQTDAWARSWSADGRYVAFTQITLIYYQGNWYWTEAYLDAWDSESGGTVRLSGEGLDWRPDWQTMETTPPSSSVHTLPVQSPWQFTVTWSGADVGPAGLDSYDVQVKDGAGGVWTDWQKATSATSAPYIGIGGHTYFFRCRARDHAGNVEPWPPDYDAVTAVEAYPPHTAVNPLPGFSRAEVTVNWGGWDPGGSGIATYDVQYTDAPGGIWADWQMNSTTTSASFSGTTGNTYYFRSRATDRAQNVEPWPPGDGDTQTAFYAWAITGTMRDSRETPLAGAVVTTTPEAFATSPSNSEGVYAAYIVHDAGMYSAAWGKKGYEDLPVTEFALSQDVQADMFLPPADNIIQDWGFESGSLGSGSWLTSGLYTPLVVDSPRHTGAYAVMLGRESSFAPPQNVSNTAPHSLQPQIAVDDLDTVHLVWTDAGIRYARRESDGTWSSPENVSTATSGLDDPQLAVGENEVVHVVWSDSSDIYYAQRASDGTWSPSQNLSDSPDEAGHPQVAVDGSGVVHVVWHDQSTGAADIYHAWRDGGGSWSSPQNLSDDPIESWSPQMAMDGNGAAHVVWWSAGGNNEVFYAMRGGDGIWSDPQNISDTPVWSEYPELVADANATVHVVWKDGDHPEYDVYYARRGSDGTWSSPANISNASANIWHSKPVLGPDGNLHVAWQQPSPSKTDIYYAFRRSEGTWSTPVNVSHSPSDARTATLTVDDHATVHLAWTEYIYPDDINVYYARRSSDETWSSPQNLTEGSGGWSWQPKIAVDGTETIHIVWAHNPDIYYRNLVPASETGDSAISQAVTVLNSDASPTLSFLHQLGGHHGTDGVWFSVGVDDGITATALFSTTTETDDWIHNWFDMTPWAGQTVTLTFNLHETVGYPTGWAYLDEITLGPAYPDLWVGKEASTRIAAPGDQVIYPISYGNRGGVAASSIQITDELPEGLSFEAASPPPSATTPSLVWDVGDLPAKSERYAIVVTTTVSDTAPLLSYLTNTVSIETTSPELETFNNSSQARVFVGRPVYLPLILKGY